MKTYEILASLILTFSGFCIGVIYGTINTTNVREIPRIIYIDSCKTKELNKKNVYEYIKKNKIKHAEIVLAQSLLETGNYTSNICKTHNNIFGFYNGRSFLKFNHWTESIEYYKKWQKKRYISGDYYTFLEGVPYAEDEDYIKKLKQIKI